MLEELRAEAMAVATGNDVERIASAVDLIDLIDSLTWEDRIPEPRPADH